MGRFRLDPEAGGYRVTLAPAVQWAVSVLMDYLLAQAWGPLEFATRLGTDAESFAALRRRVNAGAAAPDPAELPRRLDEDQFPLVTLDELHVLACALSVPRQSVAAERAFFERFHFYREEAAELERSLVAAAAAPGTYAAG
jgi:hypothetical protein